MKYAHCMHCGHLCTEYRDGHPVPCAIEGCTYGREPLCPDELLHGALWDTGGGRCHCGVPLPKVSAA